MIPGSAPPTCRPIGSARGRSRRSREATVLTVPEGTESTTPTWVSIRGEGAEAPAFGHTVVDVKPNARAVVVLEHTGSATYADNVEFVVGDGAALTVVSAPGLGRRRRAPVASPCAAGAGRPVHAHGRDAGRERGPAGAVGAVRGAWRRRRAARDLLRRRGPAPGAPAVRGPRGAQLPQPGVLQGRAAGPGRARGLDRRRGHPGRGHRDRHLRVQPEPGAHRRHPGRLRAEPGDPDRRGARRGPRQHQRPAGGPAPVLPDGPRHPAGGGQAAGDPGLLRPADRPDRGARAAGPDQRRDRARAA